MLHRECVGFSLFGFQHTRSSSGSVTPAVSDILAVLHMCYTGGYPTYQQCCVCVTPAESDIQALVLHLCHAGGMLPACAVDIAASWRLLGFFRVLGVF